MKDSQNTAAPTPAQAPLAPLAPELAAIALAWKAADIPDLYEGCLGPHGGPVSRERGRNVRGVFYPKPKLAKGKIEVLSIPGSHGDIPLQLVCPHASSDVAEPIKPVRNTLVYFHGGGWVVGDFDSHEMHAVRLANESQCVVVQVDYRLAPEHRFPCAFDDAWAATRWAHENIARLGGDTKRLAVGGDSAGGNLAAAVALAARDHGLALAAQLLIYPATDLSRMKGLPEQAYLGDQYDALCRDWRVSPAHAASHSGLCPTILGVGPHDFLYQDNLRYADKLRAAKVHLCYREYPTLNHGFFSYTAISEASLLASQQLCADLKLAFESAER